MARLEYLLVTFWLFTESNFTTFVLPNTAFGLLGALSGPHLTSQVDVSTMQVFKRLPVVILFNWSNVLIFDFANQRGAESVREDLINKPWRPLPRGRVSSEQTRRLMIVMIFVVLALNYLLGVWRETALLLILTWVYNDLKGGDEVVRDFIIAVAFALYNHGSLVLATEAHTDISDRGYIWIAIVSGVILTTMQVQDLKDQAGDRVRGRCTMPLTLGDPISRRLIAIGVVLWSFFCAYFWSCQPIPYILISILGGFIAFRAVWKCSPAEDSRTWRLWCAWTATLYTLPLLS